MKGVLDFTSAVNTLFRRGNLQVPSGNAFPLSGFANTFGLNPGCPYFRIFAGCVADTVNAFCTQFQFSLGGVPCGDPYKVVWGDVSAYNSGSTSTDQVFGLVITPALGSDSLFLESQFADACGIVIPSLGLGNGFCSRWSAQADQIVLTTTPIGTPGNIGVNAEYVHGVVQQPF